MLKTQIDCEGQGKLRPSHFLGFEVPAKSLSLLSKSHQSSLEEQQLEGGCPAVPTTGLPGPQTAQWLLLSTHVPDVPGIVFSCLVSTSCCLHSIGLRPASLSCHPSWEAVLMSPAQLQVRVIVQLLHQFLLLGLF